MSIATLAPPLAEEEYEEEEQDCESLDGCHDPAQWRVRLSWTCGCWPDVFDFCSRHRDLVLRIVSGGGITRCIRCMSNGTVASITPKREGQ